MTRVVWDAAEPGPDGTIIRSLLVEQTTYSVVDVYDWDGEGKLFIVSPSSVCGEPSSCSDLSSALDAAEEIAKGYGFVVDINTRNKLLHPRWSGNNLVVCSGADQRAVAKITYDEGLVMHWVHVLGEHEDFYYLCGGAYELEDARSMAVDAVQRAGYGQVKEEE